MASLLLSAALTLASVPLTPLRVERSTGIILKTFKAHQPSRELRKNSQAPRVLFAGQVYTEKETADDRVQVAVMVGDENRRARCGQQFPTANVQPDYD
jgi:hypothetical protein